MFTTNRQEQPLILFPHFQDTFLTGSNSVVISRAMLLHLYDINQNCNMYMIFVGRYVIFSILPFPRSTVPSLSSDLGKFVLNPYRATQMIATVLATIRFSHPFY